MFTPPTPGPTGPSRLLVPLFLVVMLALTACGGGDAATPTPTIRLGDLVTAKALGQGNAPQQPSTTFAPSDTVYAVIQVNNFPNGGRVFSRWSLNGTAKEDTQEIVADRDYSNTYLEFHIGSTVNRLDPGNWTVQLIVNGNPGPSANFTVR